jgi:hypothetical protein
MPLQRQFVGLSDQIGQFQGGNVNLDLDPFLKLVQDSYDFVNPYDWISKAVVLNAQGQTAVHDVVPEGEVHRVRYMGLNATSDGPITMVPVVFDRLSVPFGMTGPPWVATATGLTLMQGFWLDAPGIILYPGQQIGWNARVYTPPGNGDNITCDITHLRQVIKI